VTFSPEEQMMIAHCQSMHIDSCEKYADLSQDQIDEAMRESCKIMPGMVGCDTNDEYRIPNTK